ncbi:MULTISPECIES: ferritin-like protein [Burkholderiaceae]|uniref:ferritin-like domain-containing protein n=1 Tax=Burkholderiaceae TaxID=119060 RepID=UPI00096236B3|nr:MULTISPECIES: ferritin-like protein [Burkholderiaceae]MCG1019815.1 ferritin-like protein [Mycetohabitans sp. B4]SIT80161.1 Ferritin-like [Burkholderia sp. b13]
MIETFANFGTPLTLKQTFIDEIIEAQNVTDLYGPLQNAIALEHSTIPPYLTAMFSLKPGVNDMIIEFIRGIVVQEMLHMTIAANILIAIGGEPEINTPNFIPKYPGPLPMGIGGEDFKVGIEAFSMDLVKKIFMRIELPENPIALYSANPPSTIGAFYKELKNKIKELQPSFSNFARQVTSKTTKKQWFTEDKLFEINDMSSCERAIDIIVVEGEGTSTDPMQAHNLPAHYYRFKAITQGRRLIKCSNGQYGYFGEAIPFNVEGVYPMKPNPKIDDFNDKPAIQSRIKQFASYYSNLLDTLHQAFNGDPTLMDKAMGFMYDLRVAAVGLMQIPLGDGKNAGLSFEYIPLKER